MTSTAGAATNEESSERSDARELFDELRKCVKQKIVSLAQEKHNPVEIADALGLPEKAVLMLIRMMAQEGSIRITRIEPILGYGNNGCLWSGAGNALEMAAKTAQKV